MADGSSFYRASTLSGALRQGEVLSNVIETSILPGFDIEQELVRTVTKKHKLAIIVSQDCDLETDHLMQDKIRKATEKNQDAERYRGKCLTNVLFCELKPAAEAMKEVEDSWDRVSKNNDFRYHYLQGVGENEDSVSEGLEAQIVIFKRTFAVSMQDLLIRIENSETQRRVFMDSPYFEHVSDRFAHYLARVGLPCNHRVG